MIVMKLTIVAFTHEKFGKLNGKRLSFFNRQKFRKVIFTFEF